MSDPYYADDRVTLYAGDSLEVLPTLPADSVDCVVTDPPAGISFMGRDWDHHKGGRAQWAAWLAEVMREAWRVAKPGAHALVWALPRTSHWTAIGIEDAGWEIRDRVTHLFGTGFPKSLDVSKAIDRQRSEDLEPVDLVRAWLNQRRLDAGFSHDAVNKHFGHASNGGGSSSAWMTNPTSRSLPTWDQWLALKTLFGFSDDMDAEVWRLNGRKGKPGDNWDSREVLGQRPGSIGRGNWRAMEGRTDQMPEEFALTAPATPEAARWQGWGTALKPAAEDWWLARKPLVGTVAANVLRYGTGALNIAATRIGTGDNLIRPGGMASLGVMHDDAWKADRSENYGRGAELGRWPPNVALDEASAAALDQMSGETAPKPEKIGRRGGTNANPMSWEDSNGDLEGRWPADPGGGASRFFFVARDQSDTLDPCPSPNSASDAASLSNRPNVPGDSAPRAANQEPKTDLSRSARSTSETPSGSSPTSASDTPLILPTGSRPSPESRQPRRTQTSSLASDAEQPEPTDTTTTTASPSTSAGSADPATSPITSRSREPGPAALPIESLGSRFTYTAKAGSEERITHNGVAHPTVKPLALMRWLVRLVTPPGGTILDPFAGSGTTVEAAILEGVRCIAIEREPEYLPMIVQRINRRRDPIAYIMAAGEDLGLFELDEGA